MDKIKRERVIELLRDGWELGLSSAELAELTGKSTRAQKRYDSQAKELT